MEHRTRHGLLRHRWRFVRGTPVLLVGLVVACAGLLGGCTTSSWPTLSPDGPVALAERDLLIFITCVTLVVVVPVFVLTAWVVIRFRKGDAEGPYRPHWTYSKRIDLAIWLTASAAAVVIGITIWIATFRLDPYQPVGPAKDPLRVQVIAEDWKWVFIYPQQHIATVNELVFPVGRSLRLRITSDTVMNALFIPGLTSQIYAMAGMETHLNAIADKPATFVGRNAQFSGKGFPQQHFLAHAVSPADFRQWVDKVKNSTKRLDEETYDELRRPSKDVPVTYYSDVTPGLFDRTIASYRRSPSSKWTAGRQAHGQGDH